jgi:hypothetical protein
VIAEGNETPGSESGGGSEGRTRRSEGDLLAERRARRAAESGEHALTLRAEAAEATVRTLETHLASLQQRLREAEEERQRHSEFLEAERAPRSGGWRTQALAAEEVERELQRVSQREYAEQRLRLEAEDRCLEIERDGRAEIDQLSARLSSSERDARRNAARLETLQLELTEAEQGVAAEAAELAQQRSAAAVREEHALQARVSELEHRALEIGRGLEAERAARARAEQLVESMRQSQRVAVSLVSDLGDVIARLKRSASQEPPARTMDSRPGRAPTPVHDRAGEAPVGDGEGTFARGATAASAAASAPTEPQSGEMAEALAAAVERLRARVAEQPQEPQPAPVKGPPHKHSRSLIGRWRIARKQRRER